MFRRRDGLSSRAGVGGEDEREGVKMKLRYPGRESGVLYPE